MSVAIAIDLLVAGLLVATIAYAAVLNRRLSQLRGGSAQMERSINEFHQATTRAESGLMALKEIAGRSDLDIVGQLQSLTKLHDGLEFLVARAEQESARLEDLIRAGRGRAASASPGLARGPAPESGLDAELFGDPKNTPDGAWPQPRREPKATSNSAAMQELR